VGDYQSGVRATVRERSKEPSTVGSGRTGVTRRHIQIALGVLWLLDGLLQFQPFMFSRGFAATVIAPSAAGQPAWVAWPVHQAASVIGSYPVALDVVFALVQLSLGIGFLWPRTARTAVLLSVLWAIGIWLTGEGLGGLAGGSSSLLSGAPGAASLYAVLAMAAWPSCPLGHDSADRSTNGGVAEWYPLAWAAIWFDLALLALLPANRSVAAVSGQIDSSGAPLVGAHRPSGRGRCPSRRWADGRVARRRARRHCPPRPRYGPPAVHGCLVRYRCCTSRLGGGTEIRIVGQWHGHRSQHGSAAGLVGSCTPWCEDPTTGGQPCRGPSRRSDSHGRQFG
jgi:hypothetical protein